MTSSLIPRVSVLMPVFNTQRYVDSAVRSILQQDHTDFELVILDDGSTDGSGAVLQKLAAFDARIRLVQRPNKGLIATRNELLSLARAELVAWMDSDDISMKQRLRLQVGRFDADAALVCLGGAALCVDPEGWPLWMERFVTTHDEIVRGQQEGGAMRFPTTMMRREAALRVGGFREPFRIGEDLDLCMRLSEVGRMANLDDVVLEYRQHPRSTSAILSRQWEVYRDLILALAHERQAGGPDRLQRGEPVSVPPPPTAEAALRDDVHQRRARMALHEGHVPTARKYARAALKQQPTSWGAWKLALRVLASSTRRGK